jgi:hypothetical protein
MHSRGLTVRLLDLIDDKGNQCLSTIESKDS